MLSMSAQQQAARQKQRALIQSIDEQSNIQTKANDRTDQYVTDTYTPQARMTSYESGATTAEKTLGDLLTSQAATGQGAITDATSGAVSNAYLRQKAATTAATTQDAREYAKLLARSGARAELARREASASTDYSSDMLGFGADSRMAQRSGEVASQLSGGAGDGLALLGGLLSGGAKGIGGLAGKAGQIDYNKFAVPQQG